MLTVLLTNNNPVNSQRFNEIILLQVYNCLFRQNFFSAHQRNIIVQFFLFSATSSEYSANEINILQVLNIQATSVSVRTKSIFYRLCLIRQLIKQKSTKFFFSVDANIQVASFNYVLQCSFSPVRFFRRIQRNSIFCGFDYRRPLLPA